MAEVAVLVRRAFAGMSRLPPPVLSHTLTGETFGADSCLPFNRQVRRLFLSVTESNLFYINCLRWARGTFLAAHLFVLIVLAYPVSFLPS